MSSAWDSSQLRDRMQMLQMMEIMAREPMDDPLDRDLTY
jgi:hypothetical protein